MHRQAIILRKPVLFPIPLISIRILDAITPTFSGHIPLRGFTRWQGRLFWYTYNVVLRVFVPAQYIIVRECKIPCCSLFFSFFVGENNCVLGGILVGSQSVLFLLTLRNTHAPEEILCVCVSCQRMTTSTKFEAWWSIRRSRKDCLSLLLSSFCDHQQIVIPSQTTTIIITTAMLYYWALFWEEEEKAPRNSDARSNPKFFIQSGFWMAKNATAMAPPNATMTKAHRRVQIGPISKSIPSSSSSSEEDDKLMLLLLMAWNEAPRRFFNCWARCTRLTLLGLNMMMVLGWQEQWVNEWTNRWTNEWNGYVEDVTVTVKRLGHLVDDGTCVSHA